MSLSTVPLATKIINGVQQNESIPIKTENFTENENQNHADENSRLQHV